MAILSKRKKLQNKKKTRKMRGGGNHIKPGNMGNAGQPHFRNRSSRVSKRIVSPTGISRKSEPFTNVHRKILQGYASLGAQSSLPTTTQNTGQEFRPRSSLVSPKKPTEITVRTGQTGITGKRGYVALESALMPFRATGLGVVGNIQETKT